MCLHANLHAKLEKSPGVSKLSMLFVCIPSENEGDPEPQSDHVLLTIVTVFAVCWIGVNVVHFLIGFSKILEE